jgi:dienelactone hydrolase
MWLLRNAIALCLIVAAGPGLAKSMETVEFDSADGTELTGYLFYAVGREAKSPTIIALHGCGGALNRSGSKLGSRHRAWRRILTNAGYNVLFPESFASRGYRSLCKIKPRPVRQRDRVADVEGALEWLMGRDFVDKNAISLLGWSNGGGTALRVARRPFARSFRHIFSFYPGCRWMLKHPTPKPVTRLKIIMGAVDNWTSPVPCQALAKQWDVPIVLYKGAYHSFDSPSSKLRERTGLSHTYGNTGKAYFGTNYDARRKAIAEVLSTLQSE